MNKVDCMTKSTKSHDVAVSNELVPFRLPPPPTSTFMQNPSTSDASISCADVWHLNYLYDIGTANDKNGLKQLKTGPNDWNGCLDNPWVVFLQNFTYYLFFFFLLRFYQLNIRCVDRQWRKQAETIQNGSKWLKKVVWTICELFFFNFFYLLTLFFTFT